MGESIKSVAAAVQGLIVVILSWMVLVALAIIISGKLVVKRFPFGLKDDALFSIPLHYFKIKATGDEVSVGFLLFILSLGLAVIFGGVPAYQFFRQQAGIDIGQWNSLCVIACFFSLLFATFVFLLVPVFKSEPLVSDKDRKEVNDRLRGK